MRTFFMFMIVCIISNFAKEAIREDVNKCGGFAKIEFEQVEGTSGDFNEIIARQNQFVTLHGNELTIFEDYSKPIIQKSLPVSPDRLNLDLFDNILFPFEKRLGIYLPENDELIWKRYQEEQFKYFVIQENLGFDDYNNIYAITNDQISYAKDTDEFLTFLPRLDRFKKVTHLVDGYRNNFYFAHNTGKTAWIVNGVTEQTIMQTSSIKYLNYVSISDDYKRGMIFLISENCTTKVFKVPSELNVFRYSKPNLIKIMHFEDCVYRRPSGKFLFQSAKDKNQHFLFNKDKIYRFFTNNDSDNVQVCLFATLSNCTINAGAAQSRNIMLATSNGLWSFQW